MTSPTVPREYCAHGYEINQDPNAVRVKLVMVLLPIIFPFSISSVSPMCNTTN